MTAEHVAAAGVNNAVDRFGNKYRLTGVAVDQRRDLALMRLDREAPAPPLQPTNDVYVGMRVFAIGHPRIVRGRMYEQLMRWSVSNGRVSNVSDDWVAATTPAYPGNSGGPLVSCDGRLVAVASHGPDDLRIIFAGRANHLDALRGGKNAPPYRVPVEPGTTLDVDIVAGQADLGVGVGATWQSQCFWFVRVVGSAHSNVLTRDVFGQGIRTQTVGSLFIGIAAHLFRGWRYHSVRVAPALGISVRREVLRHATIGTGDVIEATSKRTLFAEGTVALRFHAGRWFVEPQASVSIQSTPRFAFHMGLGLEL